VLAIRYGPGRSTAVEFVINEGEGIEGTAWSFHAEISPDRNRAVPPGRGD
jgi:hypothetical protein